MKHVVTVIYSGEVDIEKDDALKMLANKYKGIWDGANRIGDGESRKNSFVFASYDNVEEFTRTAKRDLKWARKISVKAGE